MQVSLIEPIEFWPLGQFTGWNQINFHRMLLTDEIRTGSFIKAIEAAVRPGDIVTDLGAGTGVLSMAAKRAGAAEVYSIEMIPRLAGLVEQNAKANNLDIQVFSMPSFKMQPPKPVDMIVSECIGPFVNTSSFQIESVLGFRDQFMKDNPRIIPNRLRALFAPVDCEYFHNFVHHFRTKPYGFDWTPWANLQTGVIWTVHAKPEHLMCESQVGYDIDLLTASVMDAFPMDIKLSFKPTKEGTFHGIAGWWDGVLYEDITIDTGPNSDLTVWKQNFVAANEAVKVTPDSTIDFHFQCVPTTPEFGLKQNKWSFSVKDGDGKEILNESHSTRGTHPDPPAEK